MTKYKVNSEFSHDGRTYKKGEVVDLNESVAKQLVEDKVLTVEHVINSRDLPTETQRANLAAGRKADENSDGSKNVT